MIMRGRDIEIKPDRIGKQPSNYGHDEIVAKCNVSATIFDYANEVIFFHHYRWLLWSIRIN
jgi:hypothetical protein